MSNLPRVLVTGATGKTGRATVLALTEHHADVVQTRAMVRKDDARAQALREAGAEVVLGDMGDLRDVRRAMHGVQRAHFLAPITNNSLDYGVNFAVAAKEARLEHVAALSQWLATPTHPSVITRRTWLVDEVLSWIPGAEHTLINVGFFADNVMSVLGSAAQFGMLPLPLGAGSTALISNEDIGRVVAGVLSDPERFAGRTLRPTGPEVLSPDEIAAVFGEVLGRDVRYAESSERMFLKAIGAQPDADKFVQAQVVHYLREYRRGTFSCGGVTDVVEEVTGRPAEDLATIARRYVASEPLARPSFSNRLRAMGQMVKILLTPVPDLKRWERETGLPVVDGVDCADDPEWQRTHARPNAFGVAQPTEPVRAVA